MLGPPVTVKVNPLLLCPATVTTTKPVVVPVETGTMMEPGPQLKGVALVPLKVIVLLPWGEPKPEPLTVTLVLTGPELGERLVMLGGGMTVKLADVDCTPTFTVRDTTPPAAPVGTGTPMLPSFQLVGVAAVLPKETVLDPAAWVAPKFAPDIVTPVPYLPEVGETLVIVGAGIVKETPLLAWPLTVTTTLPVVDPGTVTPMLPAPQEVTLAAVPLNLTVLEP